MAKIRLDESTMYIIRCKYEGVDFFYYYQTPTDFCLQPTMATIFRDYDIAEMHMIASHNFNPDEGFIYDVVPYMGELATVKSK